MGANLKRIAQKVKIHPNLLYRYINRKSNCSDIEVAKKLAAEFVSLGYSVTATDFMGAQVSTADIFKGDPL